MAYLSQALKEWAIVVEALVAGQLMLLLRKGGIREVGGRFQASSGQRFWLYPTTEHQQAHGLRSPYRERLPHPDASWEREPAAPLPLQAWAELTHCVPLTDAAALAALSPYHIWSEAFVAERWAWKPHQPLWLLLLRTYRLPQSIGVPDRPAYRGCRSWIDLEVSLPTEPATPVIATADYDQRVQKILQHLPSATPL